jgi:hypothetical protein
VALSGVVFGGAGIAFLLDPSWVRFVDLEPMTATAASDVRAVFGGLEIGVGVFLLWAAIWPGPGWLRAGLTAQVTTFGGLALGRVVSFFIDGWPGLLSLALFAGELLGAGLGLLVAGYWSREGRESRARGGAAAVLDGADPDEGES